VLAIYEVVQRRVTSDRDAIRGGYLARNIREIETLDAPARTEKRPSHKVLDTNLYLWKKAGTYTSRGENYVLYQCPMSHRCKCQCCLRRVFGSDFVELQRSGLHDASSHENDGSKYLKHDQIVALHDATVTAPQLSGTMLLQNLQFAESPNKK
jgi:hypothetical protein